MNQTPNIKFSFLFIIFTISLFHIHACNAATVFVEIENRLPGGSVLTLNCNSQDEDLGDKIVNPGSDFRWMVGGVIPGIQRIYCRLRWGSKTAYVATHSGAGLDCHNRRSGTVDKNTCYFQARDSGVYFNKYDDPGFPGTWIIWASWVN